jgi:PAX-interacting protein 1
MVVANAGVPPVGGVLQQQSPLVGAVVGTPGVGAAVAKSPYSQTAATAARVAAALAKSAQSVGQVQQQPRAQFYGHNPNMKLPPDLFLLGCIFFVVDYESSMPEEVAVWQRVVASSGGEVETVYGPRVTHVLCETQKSATFHRALREGKRCVTAYWLNDVVLKQQVLPPWQALHFPTPFSDDKPCKNHIIAFSGFEGEERARIRFTIEATGAKCTSYFTKHNHILVCRRLEGAKYKKAREWNRPVVNAQWLNEILFGHYSCIQQPDMQKFQQFNLGNPFRIDYGLIPHLMAAWKMPINVTQESYDKVKSIPPHQRRVKRPRVEKSLASGGDSDQENTLENVEVTNLDPPSGDKRPVVLFSHVTKQSELAKKIKQLGGAVVDSNKEATHLVMSEAVRTIKLLCCLSTCKFILSEAWIRDSHAHNTFLDEKPYILSDTEFEKEFDCHISKVLEKPNRTDLFKDKVFYITPGVIPSPSALADVIECAGGKVEKHRRSHKAIQEANQKEYSYFVITVGNDLHLLRDLIKCDIGVFNAEFVLSSVMRQEINYGAKTTL